MPPFAKLRDVSPSNVDHKLTRPKAQTNRLCAAPPDWTKICFPDEERDPHTGSCKRKNDRKGRRGLRPGEIMHFALRDLDALDMPGVNKVFRGRPPAAPRQAQPEPVRFANEFDVLFAPRPPAPSEFQPASLPNAGPTVSALDLTAQMANLISREQRD